MEGDRRRERGREGGRETGERGVVQVRKRITLCVRTMRKISKYMYIVQSMSTQYKSWREKMQWCRVGERRVTHSHTAVVSGCLDDSEQHNDYHTQHSQC